MGQSRRFCRVPVTSDLHPNNGHYQTASACLKRAITGSRNAPVHYRENGFLKLNVGPVRQAASILPSWLMPGIIGQTPKR
jgi:hypothetical protein